MKQHVLECGVVLRVPVDIKMCHVDCRQRIDELQALWQQLVDQSDRKGLPFLCLLSHVNSVLCFVLIVGLFWKMYVVS